MFGFAFMRQTRCQTGSLDVDENKIHLLMDHTFTNSSSSFDTYDSVSVNN